VSTSGWLTGLPVSQAIDGGADAFTRRSQMGNTGETDRCHAVSQASTGPEG